MKIHMSWTQLLSWAHAPRYLYGEDTVHEHCFRPWVAYSLTKVHSDHSWWNMSSRVLRMKSDGWWKLNKSIILVHALGYGITTVPQKLKRTHHLLILLVHQNHHSFLSLFQTLTSTPTFVISQVFALFCFWHCVSVAELHLFRLPFLPIYHLRWLSWLSRLESSLCSPPHPLQCGASCFVFSF